MQLKKNFVDDPINRSERNADKVEKETWSVFPQRKRKVNKNE